jgi:hypothetical protein
VSTNNGSSYDAGASDYAWSISANGASNNDDADSFIRLTHNNMGNSAGLLMSGWFELTQPSGQYFIMESFGSHVWSGTAILCELRSGMRLTTTPVNAVEFLQSTGNISTGTFLLFRRKRSA